MTLVDSADSVLMLYSYSGFPERSFFVFEKREKTASGVMREATRRGWEGPEKVITGEDNKQDKAEEPSALDSESVQVEEVREAMGEDLKPAQIKIGDPEKLQESEEKMAVIVDEGMERDRQAKLNVMSGLSITLTLMSILVAFR